MALGLVWAAGPDWQARPRVLGQSGLRPHRTHPLSSPSPCSRGGAQGCSVTAASRWRKPDNLQGVNRTAQFNLHHDLSCTVPRHPVGRAFIQRCVPPHHHHAHPTLPTAGGRRADTTPPARRSSSSSPTSFPEAHELSGHRSAEPAPFGAQPQPTLGVTRGGPPRLGRGGCPRAQPARTDAASAG